MKFAVQLLLLVAWSVFCFYVGSAGGDLYRAGHERDGVLLVASPLVGYFVCLCFWGMNRR